MILAANIIAVAFNHSRGVRIFVHEGADDSQLFLLLALYAVVINLELNIQNAAVALAVLCEGNDNCKRRCHNGFCGS
ncbi:MAG: hypothetical protein ACRERR_03230 [Moraxellaceae bacterium]